MPQARVIHIERTIGKVIVGCLKCGAPLVLTIDGKKTDEEERTCCGCIVDFLHIAVTNK